MKSLWNDDDARAAIERYAPKGVNEDLALAVYSTRLIGKDTTLVLHGGGNSSVKTRVRDVTGEDIDVLCVKGSGWDMVSIEPPGLPAVRLEPLQKLVGLPALSDEDMVNIQRRNLLDSTAPNPSVETLLHAFLPHKFIQHTHANAVLALCDQPDGERVCREVFGPDVVLVPYVMPGFALAKRVRQIHDDHPGCRAIVLLKHGALTFADDAREAYERMIELVSAAEAHLAKAARPLPGRNVMSVDARHALAARLAPLLRGLLAEQTGPGQAVRTLLTFRTSDAIVAYVDGAELDRHSQSGPVTPDHVIRTKPWPAILPGADDLEAFASGARAAIAAYVERYRQYFARENQRVGGNRKMLDPYPRVMLVPGVGLFAAGASRSAADIAADLAEVTVDVVSAAESIARFESIPVADIFDMEYWSLEQAKLGKSQEKPLARHVVVVTGGASGIGLATAAAFKAEGAEVAIFDLPGAALDAVAKQPGAFPVPCDVTNRAAVAAAFARVCTRFGGVDIVVSNAGAAWQGAVGDVDEALLRRSFELNFWAHQHVAQTAVEIMRQQGTGGALLFNVSKQAMNAGPKMGPYGLPKAATLHLMRQYALDHGPEGIRANAVNADRIRTGLLTDDMIRSRAEARGVSEREYMSGNLLGVEVTAEDVARAFVHLALSRATTAAVLTVDGGNIAAAVR